MKSRWSFYLTLGLVLLLLALVTKIADASTGLAITSQVPALNGQPVSTDQTGQLYRTPTDTDLVRVSPSKTSWSPDYRWKQFGQLATGEFYEVCLGDVPSGTSVPGSDNLCGVWGYIAKAAPVTCPTVGSNPIKVSWTPPMQNTDGTPVDTPISYKLYMNNVVALTTFALNTNVTASTGPHYLFVTAVTVKGESAPSSIGCKTIRLSAPSNGKIEAPSNGSIVPK